MSNRDLFPVMPSVGECKTAREIFLAAYQVNAHSEGHEVALRIALDAVWANARKYQMDKQTALIEG